MKGIRFAIKKDGVEMFCSPDIKMKDIWDCIHLLDKKKEEMRTKSNQ